MKKLSVYLAALATLSIIGTANAEFFAGSAGGKSATADITYDAGTQKLTIVLTNTTATTGDAADLLTGLSFPGSGAFTSASIDSRTGLMTTIAAGGQGTVPAGPMTDWGFEGAVLDWKPSPDGGIIGPPSSFNGANPVWGSANASVAGNGPHNPFVYQTATFVLSAPGYSLGADPKVTFYFGTNLSPDIPDVPGGGVPEPASLGILALGGVALLTRRRKA